MTKIIHCIKVGPNSELGDFELSCVGSWIKAFPDWEIKYWTDAEILPMLSDCRYAVSCYNNRAYAFAMDYVKLKILYENGGLYMDTDVFCVNRIPDSCFETAFTSWDPGFGTYWSQNGTCLYCEPGNEIVKEIIDLYKTFDEFPKYSVDNTVAEMVLRAHGINFTDRTTCQLTNQDLGGFKVYNCVQFGAFDYIQNQMWSVPKELPIYLVHARTKSWVKQKDENTYLYYAFIDDNTDVIKLYWAVDAFIKMDMGNLGATSVLVLGLNTTDGRNANWMSRRLAMELQGQKKGFLVAPLGTGLDDDELNSAFLDFVTKRFNKIKFCRDVMEGEFTGTLEV